MKVNVILTRLLLMGLFFLQACASTSATSIVYIKQRAFQVEIADQPEEQEIGLMFRRKIDADQGMLFVFEQEKNQAFWMKNCFINLDILFFDAQGQFINGHYNVPPCNSNDCQIYESTKPAKYVLELKGGVGFGLDLAPQEILALPKKW